MLSAGQAYTMQALKQAEALIKQVFDLGGSDIGFNDTYLPFEARRVSGTEFNLMNSQGYPVGYGDVTGAALAITQGKDLTVHIPVREQKKLRRCEENSNAYYFTRQTPRKHLEEEGAWEEWWADYVKTLRRALQIEE